MRLQRIAIALQVSLHGNLAGRRFAMDRKLA